MRRPGLALLFVVATAQLAVAQDSTTEPDAATATDPGNPAEPPVTEATDAADPGRPVDKGVFGVGIVLGEPTGIAAKLYLNDNTAIQGALGFNFYGSGIQVNAEYVLHPWIVQEREAFTLPIYLGPGLRFIQYDGGRGEDSHFAIGLRGVVGMLFDFKEVPLDVFLEVAGVIEYDFTEAFEPALNLGAGVRYYF